MTPITVTYARLFNLGNYEHERIEMQLSLEEGDSAAEALAAAKAFVSTHAPNAEFGGVSKSAYDHAAYVLSRRDDHLVKEVADAELTVTRYEKAKDEAERAVSKL